MFTKPITIFLPSLRGGGAEKAAANLIRGMVKRNLRVDLVLASVEGPYLNQIPKQVRIVDLATGRVIKAIFPLSNYLRRERPQALLSYMGHTNVVAALAREWARTKTKLVLVDQNTLSDAQINFRRAKFVRPLMKLLYPRADALVACSDGVSRDIEVQLGLATGKVQTIYNPIVEEKLINLAQAPVNHPWFLNKTCPIILAAGRLTEQKDFMTLLKAFALVRQQITARLVILGEGQLRPRLAAQIDKLNLDGDVDLLGFVNNPYAYMSKADVFVLSSRWEGLGNVLIEAIACGCPVASTDCPNGPREILERGRYGILVPVGKVEELSQAILDTLNQPLPKEILQQRGWDFSLERSLEQYLDLILPGDQESSK